MEANETLEVCVCVCVCGWVDVCVVPLYISDNNSITINHSRPLRHWEINQEYQNAMYFILMLFIYSGEKNI